MRTHESKVTWLKALGVVGVGGSSAGLLLGFLGVGISLVRPNLGMNGLYRRAMLADEVGFASVFVFVAYAIVALYIAKQVPGLQSFFSQQRPGSQSRHGWALRLDTLSAYQRLCLGGILVCCSLAALTLVQGFTFVKPAETGWVSVSRAGSFGISEALARAYLWRVVRFFSVVFTGSSFLAAVVSTGVIRLIRPLLQPSQDVAT